MNKLYNSDFTVRCGAHNPEILVRMHPLGKKNFTFPKTCLLAGRYTEMSGYGACLGPKVIFSNNEYKINKLHNYMFANNLSRYGEGGQNFILKKYSEMTGAAVRQQARTASFFPNSIPSQGLLHSDLSTLESPEGTTLL
jgi:hypothetical protein